MPSDKTSLIIPFEITHEVRKRAIDEGVSMSAIVTAFLKAWIAGKIEIPRAELEEERLERKRKQKE